MPKRGSCLGSLSWGRGMKIESSKYFVVVSVDRPERSLGSGLRGTRSQGVKEAAAKRIYRLYMMYRHPTYIYILNCYSARRFYPAQC